MNKLCLYRSAIQSQVASTARIAPRILPQEEEENFDRDIPKQVGGIAFPVGTDHPADRCGD